MRVLLGSVFVALVAVALAGCGGGGGGSTPSVPDGAIEGTIYLASVSGAPPRLTVGSTADNRVGSLPPAVGAAVSVRGYPNLRAVTNSVGFFHLDNVPTGLRTFIIEYSGDYTQGTFTQEVVTGSNVVAAPVTVELAPLEWVVMVYMAADNNLDEYGVYNLNKMEAANASSKVKTVVLCDRSTNPINNPDARKSTYRYYIQHDDDTNTITSPYDDLGQQDTGNPATLNSFIQTCQANFPARHYLLVLWDHGTGWSWLDDTRSPTMLRSIAYDDTSGTWLRNADIPPILAQARYPVDIIATDACLMGMLEVAYEWRNSADYFLGAEDTTTVYGYPYDAVLNLLTNVDGAVTPKTYAVDMAAAIQSYWEAHPDPGIAPTQSAIDMSKVSAVATALNTFAANLISVKNTQESQLFSAWSETQKFSGITYPNLDLYDYAVTVSAGVNNSKVDSSATALKNAVTSAVLYNGHNDLRPNAHGLAIFAPPQSFFVRNASYNYSGTKLAADTQWNEWLTAQPY